MLPRPFAPTPSAPIVAPDGITRDGLQQLVDSLPATGGVIDITSGAIRFDRPVVVSKPNTTIRLYSSVELIVDNAREVGLFHFVEGADNAQLQGRGLLRSRKWVSEQHWVRFERVMYPRVDGLRFVAEVDGMDGPPQVQLAFEDCFLVDVQGGIFSPNGGTISLLIRGQRYRFSVANNTFGSLDPVGLNPGASLAPSPAYAVGAVRIVGSGFGHLRDNWFWFLGDPSRPADYAVRFDRYLAGNPVVENGHLLITGNQFEGIAAHRCVEMNGLTTAVFANNAFGYAQGFPVNVGQAALYMTGALAVPSNLEAAATSGVQVVSNQFHNLNGGSGASHVYADDVSVCQFQGNAHNLMNGAGNGKAYHFDRGSSGAGSARRCVIDGNVFHAAAPTSPGPLILLDTRIFEGISIRQNRYSRFGVFLTDLSTLVSGNKLIGDNLSLT